eukprot:gene24114-194_t
MGKRSKAFKPGPQLRAKQSASRKKGLKEARAVAYPGMPRDFLPDPIFSAEALEFLYAFIPRKLRPVTASAYNAARVRLSNFAVKAGHTNLWSSTNAIILTMASWFKQGRGPATWNCALAMEMRLQSLSSIPRPSSHSAVQGVMVTARAEWARHAELTRPAITFGQFKRLRKWARKFDRINDHQHFDLYLNISWVFGLRISEALELKPSDMCPDLGCIFLQQTKTEASRRLVQIRFLKQDYSSCVKITQRARDWPQEKLGLNGLGQRVSEDFIRETLLQAQFELDFQFGEDTTGTLTPHCFRHARAVQLIYADVPRSSIKNFLRMQEDTLNRYQIHNP